MASPLEMLHLGQELDIPGQMQKADIGYQQYQVQKAGLEQQQKEIAGEQNAPTGLDKQANLAVPKTWTLDSPDGMLTPGGEINRLLVDGKKNQADGMKMLKEAKYATNPQEKEKLIDAGRRLFDEGGRLQKEGHEATKKTVGGLFYGLGTAGSKDDWDNTLKSYQDSGIPLPEGFPKEYSPENKRKVRAIAAAKDPEIAKKIDAENRAVEDQQMQRDAAKRKAIKESASEQSGISGPVETKGQLESFINKVNNKANKADKVPTGVGKTVLEQIDPEYRSDLDTSKGIKDVGNKISVARGAYGISDFIREKGIKVGKVGEIRKFIDSLGLKDPDAQLDPNVVYKAIDNQELAKKVIDFANAYARAESGRNIATVAEFKTAMKTFGEASMSGKSAEYVFKNIGDEKVKQIENDYFGGNKAVNVKGHETKNLESVTVGNKTYSRPSGMSDVDWSEYQKYVGAKPKEAKQ